MKLFEIIATSKDEHKLSKFGLGQPFQIQSGEYVSARLFETWEGATKHLWDVATKHLNDTSKAKKAIWSRHLIVDGTTASIRDTELYFIKIFSQGKVEYWCGDLETTDKIDDALFFEDIAEAEAELVIARTHKPQAVVL